MPKNPNLAALRTFRLSTPYHRDDRHLLLAYGLARGLPMERLESPNSDPYKFQALDWNRIADTAARAHRPADEGVSATDHAATVETFKSKVLGEIKAWHKRLSLHWMELDVIKRKRNAEKRSAHREHPRPNPRTSASRVA